MTINCAPTSILKEFYMAPVRPVPEIAGVIFPYNLGGPAIQYNSINIHWLLLFLIFLESLHQDLLDNIKK